MSKIIIYDTTLRDGAQAEDVYFTADDKLKIALKLDEFGIPFIEGGWPGSNAVDDEFFRDIANYELKQAKIVAFGSTHHPEHSASTDPTLAAILASGAKYATLFGKSWQEHVDIALRVSYERNLELIRDSIRYLCANGLTVFFDAEHFFDGYKAHPDYSLEVLRTAREAGARTLVLCDTNGGSLPEEIEPVCRVVCEAFPETEVGIHAHNDCELGVANSLAAIDGGVSHIQGSINGIGERCGNANLTSVIPIVNLKSGGQYHCLPKEKLADLSMISNYVAEVANMSLFARQPFVGRSAFAHKGGVHVSAVSRKSSLYEHINPDAVGNRQRVLITELAGRSNIVSLAKRFGFHLDKDEPVVRGLHNELKKKTAQGYDFAAAEASVELLLLKKLGRHGVRQFFELINFRVLETKQLETEPPTSEATVTVCVEGVEEHTAAYGHGPINALDTALRKALAGFYPRLTEMRLIDFKVRVLANVEEGGTASVVRVLIESGDHSGRWVTVGVSFNIIEASWQALADSITYKLYKDEYEHRQKQE